MPTSHPLGIPRTSSGLRPFTPSGTGGFDDLQRSAIRFDVFGVEILASDLADIIRSKVAADRPQDRQDVIVLREILRRREAAD
jgi:hypothetical protein